MRAGVDARQCPWHGARRTAQGDGTRTAGPSGERPAGFLDGERSRAGLPECVAGSKKTSARVSGMRRRVQETRARVPDDASSGPKDPRAGTGGCVAGSKRLVHGSPGCVVGSKRPVHGYPGCAAGSRRPAHGSSGCVIRLKLPARVPETRGGVEKSPARDPGRRRRLKTSRARLRDASIAASAPHARRARERRDTCTAGAAPGRHACPGAWCATHARPRPSRGPGRASPGPYAAQVPHPVAAPETGRICGPLFFRMVHDDPHVRGLASPRRQRPWRGATRR